VTEITASGVFLRQQSPFMLISIKLLHTVIWAFLAASILVLPKKLLQYALTGEPAKTI
jgi:hypothetical protein